MHDSNIDQLPSFLILTRKISGLTYGLFLKEILKLPIHFCSKHCKKKNEKHCKKKNEKSFCRPMSSDSRKRMKPLHFSY